MESIRFNKIENEHTRQAGTELLVARFDLLHPVVSGNKLFKLHYFTEDCLSSPHKTMLTYGGAYSNHLAAAAFLCREKGLRSIGIVRGEAPADLSHTLLQCRKYGMQLHFISRADYAELSSGDGSAFKDLFGDFTNVPEGGYSKKGAAGASLMYDMISDSHPTHICTATGTAATVAGLMMKCKKDQEIISVPVIKNMNDLPQRTAYLLNEHTVPAVFADYSFGGYAKYTPELIAFMNRFYEQHSMPSDFVYTAKMFYAVTEKIKEGYFKKGSRIVCIHTGGLQGNLSLPPGTLIF